MDSSGAGSLSGPGSQTGGAFVQKRLELLQHSFGGVLTCPTWPQSPFHWPLPSPSPCLALLESAIGVSPGKACSSGLVPAEAGSHLHTDGHGTIQTQCPRNGVECAGPHLGDVPEQSAESL